MAERAIGSSFDPDGPGYELEPESLEPKQWGRCHDPDCDGPAGHDGPHYQWIPE